MPADLKEARCTARQIELAAWILITPPVVLANTESYEEELEGRNSLTLILAGTSDEDDDVFTIGLDFEHRVHRFLGLGAVVEYATDDIDAVTLLGVADLHVWRGLALQTGPGVEFVGEEEEEEGRTTTENRRFFVYRTGLVYEFEVGEFLVTPPVHYDFSTGEDAVVYGLGLGFEF